MDVQGVHGLLGPVKGLDAYAYAESRQFDE
jgi:hypothetical protein